MKFLIQNNDENDSGMSYKTFFKSTIILILSIALVLTFIIGGPFYINHISGKSQCDSVSLHYFISEFNKQSWKYVPDGYGGLQDKENNSFIFNNDIEIKGKHMIMNNFFSYIGMKIYVQIYELRINKDISKKSSLINNIHSKTPTIALF